MDCVYRRNQILVRVAVIGNGIGQVQRLSYLSDIQMKIETGRDPFAAYSENMMYLITAIIINGCG